MNATFCIHLNILGTFEVKYVYVCNAHTEEYERELGKWVVHKRPVSSLHVSCNRCTQIAEQQKETRVEK